jgi:hypothetical protein
MNLRARYFTVFFALSAANPQDDPLVVLREIECVPANVALEAYDASVSLALAAYRSALEPLIERWAGADEEFEALRSAARSELEQGLGSSAATSARKEQVEEALRIEGALQAMEAGESPPLLPPVGRPARGSKKWRGRFYRLFEENLDWHAARARCRELGGMLACAETQEELDHLRGLIDGWTWVGARDAAAEHQWEWLSGGEVSVEWADNQPDNANGREHAAALTKSGDLHDRHAYERSAFLCEWGATLPHPWNFESRGAVRAVEGYDEALASAVEDRGETRARILKGTAKPLAACEDDLARALDELLEALDDATRRETRLGRAGTALQLRGARDALAAGASRPVLPSLDLDAAPEDALSFGGRRYKVFGEALTWHAAEERCRELGGRIAVLSDPGVREFLLGVVGRGGAWVGAIRIDREYLWPDGTSVADGWGKGEPNNYGGFENAVVFKPNGLNDGDSESRLGWICEW